MAKAERILSIYDRLLAGKYLSKAEEASRFQVNERTIQRDLDDIRAHLSEGRLDELELVYDKRRMGYRILKKKGSKAGVALR